MTSMKEGGVQRAWLSERILLEIARELGRHDMAV